MLKFSQHFIIEMAALSSELESDDKGKLHELLLGKHLNPDKDENGVGKLPEHHRSESEEYGGTPQQVHDRLKEKVGPAAYAEVENHAKQTADASIEHMKNEGHIPDDHEIESVHWTSNRDTNKSKGDHEKTTGIKDVNSNGDLIITTRNKNNHQDKRYIPISAKYGTEEEPNYKNAGLKSLAQGVGHDQEAYTKLLAAHDQHMNDIGYTGSKKDRHKQYKLDKAMAKAEREQWKINGKNPKEFVPQSPEAKRATEGENSSLETRKKMARMHEEGLSKMSESELREHITNQVSAPTRFRHIIAHSHVQNDGSAISRIENAEDVANNHLSNYKNIRVRSGNGITSDIMGTGADGKEVVIARQGFKGGSGPHKGVAGFFKLEGTKRAEKAEKKSGKKTTPVASAPKPAPVSAPAPVQAPAAKPRAIKKSFVQHVAKAAPKQKRRPVAGDNPDSPMSSWASGEVNGAQFKSRSEM
jgi:hypothetical protein